MTVVVCAAGYHPQPSSQVTHLSLIYWPPAGLLPYYSAAPEAVPHTGSGPDICSCPGSTVHCCDVMRTLTRITNCLLSQEPRRTPDTCPLQNQKISRSIISTIAASVPILLNTRYGQKKPLYWSIHIWSRSKSTDVCEHFKQHTCDVLQPATRRTRRTSNINDLHLKTAPTTLICNYFPAIKYLSSWNEPGSGLIARDFVFCHRSISLTTLF